jgi:hypothetical protein
MGAERKPHRASERLGIRCCITIAGGRHTPRQPTDHGFDQDVEDLAGERETRPQQRNGIGHSGPARRPQRIRRTTAHCLDGGHLGSIRGLVEVVSVNQCPRADPIRGSRIVGDNS